MKDYTIATKWEKSDWGKEFLGGIPDPTYLYHMIQN